MDGVSDPFHCTACGRWFEAIEDLDDHACPARPVATAPLSACCGATIQTQAPGSGDLSTECASCGRQNPPALGDPARWARVEAEAARLRPPPSHPAILDVIAFVEGDRQTRALAMRQQAALREAYFVQDRPGARPKQVIDAYLTSMRRSEPEA